MSLFRTLPIALATALLACNTPAAAPAPVQTPAPTPTPAGPPAAGPIDASWVSGRVEEARARLAPSEAGRLLWQAIDAHGGLEAWLAQGTIRFEFDYAPIGQPERRMHTVSRVDTWRARAV